jgi:dihydropteroate synthase
MGILNLTPDSFSDGGLWEDSGAAVEAGLRMVEEGADLLDVGGESTRPGAKPVSLEEELRRVLPVVRGLRRQTDCPISIDTMKAGVARQALAEGADVINDVSALRADPEMLQVLSDSEAGVVLMHMQGRPSDMQRNPDYEDVTGEICAFLRERVEVCLEAGLAEERICVDPGFGFGKTAAHNEALLRDLPQVVALGYPVLVGLSRKSYLGHLTGEADPRRRLWAGVALTSYGREQGASIFRVHEVPPHRHALRVTEAILAHA